MNFNLVIIMAFVTIILFSYSSHFSYAKLNNEKEQDNNKDLNKNIFNSSINKNETHNDHLSQFYIQNNNANILNDDYPNQYYVCGYPKQLITDYSFLEKLNCD